MKVKNNPPARSEVGYGVPLLHTLLLVPMPFSNSLRACFVARRACRKLARVREPLEAVAKESAPEEAAEVHPSK